MCPPLQILLVSTSNALLSRLMLAELGDQSMHTKSGNSIAGIDQVLATDKAEWSSHARKMLEDSGIQHLEIKVFGFLYKNSGALKLLSLLDDTVKLLQVQLCI